MSPKAKTIDEYLAGLNEDQREALQALRQVIREAAPKAEECIRYGICAFRLDRILVGFGATARHCAFYLMSNTVREGFGSQLKDYDTSKGTIRFPVDKPLPATLVRKLVKARMAENAKL